MASKRSGSSKKKANTQSVTAKKKAAKKSAKKTAAKKTAKKSAKKSSAKKRSAKKKAAPKPQPAPVAQKKSAPQWSLIVGVLVVIAVVIFIISLATPRQGASEPVIVTIDGNPIFASEVDMQYDRLPAEMQEQYSKEVILEQTIDKHLVLQRSAEVGITVSDDEIDARIEEIVATLGINTGQLYDVLEQQNVSIRDYQEAVREELILTKFAEQEVIQKIAIDPTEITAYYSENFQQFLPNQGEIRVGHILVEEESLAQSLAARVREGENFAALAQQYSVGPSGPNGGNLGVMSAETAFVEPFKSVALALGEGEVSEPTQTEFGWHVIVRYNDLLPFEAVGAQIEQSLRENLASTQFQELIEQMRSDAEIVYLNQEDA